MTSWPPWCASANSTSPTDRGKGVPEDLQQAYVWFSVAVANGYNDTFSVPYGTDAASIRDSIGKTLSSEQLAEAQALATHYFEQYQPQ